MITIIDSLRRPTPPAWLVGAQSLCQGMGQHGTSWHCGEAATLSQDAPWCDLGDGYGISGQFETDDIDALARMHIPYQTSTEADLRGNEWQCPVIIDEDGQRAFAVAYGDDWLPALTPEQERVLAMAQEARGILLDKREADKRAGLAWAAEFLCLVYHLTPRIIAKTRILDDALMLGALSTGASVRIKYG
jgi:hypothetical protein